MPRRRLPLAALVTALLATALAACGNQAPSTGGAAASPKPSVTADAALAAMVPASVKSDGKITVGTDATYAPSEFLDTDGKTVIGFDVDLFNAVAKKLGLTVAWTPAPFDSIITGVQSNKYEAGVSSFTINPDRLKQVNMVSYFSAGTQWATKSGNPSGIQPDNACGHKVAVQATTVQADDLAARSKTCTGAGKAAITIDQYQGQDDATNAVVTGKDDAMVADSPVVAYAVTKTNGQLQTLGAIYASAPYGYVVPKDQTQFAQAIQKAVTALIADGTYQKILTNWGVQAGAVTESKINP